MCSWNAVADDFEDGASGVGAEALGGAAAVAVMVGVVRTSSRGDKLNSGAAAGAFATERAAGGALVAGPPAVAAGDATGFDTPANVAPARLVATVFGAAAF